MPDLSPRRGNDKEARGGGGGGYGKEKELLYSGSNLRVPLHRPGARDNDNTWANERVLERDDGYGKGKGVGLETTGTAYVVSSLSQGFDHHFRFLCDRTHQ